MSVSPIFRQLVSTLQQHKRTIAVVESCCGGWINTGILAQPGASSVYYGGTIAYNTRKSKPLLLNDDDLYHSLVENHKKGIHNAHEYISSKIYWTKQTSLAYCQQLGVDYCIAEGGAAGPTFHYDDLKTGFAVLSIAGRADATTYSTTSSHAFKVLRHRVVHSTHANRIGNMKLFAESAAELALQVILEREQLIVPPTDSKESIDSMVHVQSVESHDTNDPMMGCRMTLDRATHLRSSTDLVQQLASSPTARYVPLRNSKSLFVSPNEKKASTESVDAITDNEQTRDLAYLTKKQVDQVCQATKWTTQTSFLGLLHDRNHTTSHNGPTDDELQQPVFGVDFKGHSDDDSLNSYDENASLSHVLSQKVAWEDTRSVAPFLPPLQNELVLYATALAQWQRRTEHCPACGGITTLDVSANRRTCTQCGVSSWPRQDPSMIAAIGSRDGQRLLLARSARHPPRMHTVLAGFVEAGETMERAVEREVYEETSLRIDVDSVRYVASQPWPFPQSTMIGFLAQADDATQQLRIDQNELVEASWFTREQVLAATTIPGPVMQHQYVLRYLETHPDTPFFLPPRGVLARRLIEAWLHGQ